MTPQEITNYYNGIVASLDNKELKNAFDSLRQLMLTTKEYGCLDKLNEMYDTYKYMLRYRMEGANDPMQQQIYHQLLSSAYELADTLKHTALLKDSPRTYYSRLRTIDLPKAYTYEELAGILAASHEGVERAAFDQALLALFDKIWVSAPLTVDDAAEIQRLLLDESQTYVSCEIVSALMLALQESFDERKLRLLFDAADQPEPEVKIRAIIGILLTLYIYRNRMYLYPRTAERLAELAEQPGFVALLRAIILKFILSRETEKITKKLQTEIIPQMMKLTPKLNKKLNIQDFTSETAGDGVNPEWEKMLENSGFAEKMKEFSELQMEGADVMHSSFIHLKSYPFFRETGNWFLPFSAQHASIAGNNLFAEKNNAMLEALTGSSFICNSDKYSIYFSLMNLPPEQRSMLARQFNGEAAEFMEQKKETLNFRQKEESIISEYIQDLYRFYKVYPQRAEFNDIFDLPLDFHNLPMIKPYISDTESLNILAEYYLKKNYYEDAWVIFRELSERKPTDAVLFQKIGFCQETGGRYAEALDTYIHAELLDGNNKWTLRHIAKLYRATGQPEKALAYYTRLEQAEPDNLSVQVNIGHCYLELKDYDKALKCFFKVDYLDSKSHKAWRPIAWCSFITGKYEQAETYYDKIVLDRPNEQDFLNAGHTQLALRRYKKALELYKRSVQSEQNNYHKFMEQFRQDLPELKAAGIPENDIPLLLDELRYMLEE